MEISYSRIKSFRQCPKYYEYAHVIRVEPKRKPLPFALGGSIHEMIEAYRRGQDWRMKLKILADEFSRLSVDEKEFYGNLPVDVDTIVTGYIRKYEQEDRGLQFIAIEKSYDPVILDDNIGFVAKPDAVVKDTMDRVWLLEMKTGKRLPQEDFRMWNIQSLLYAWALRENGVPVYGILWDHIKSKPPSHPSLNQDGSMSRRVIDTTYETYYNDLVANHLNPADYKDMLDKLKDSKDFYVRYRLPVKQNMLDMVVKDARVTAQAIQATTHYPRNISVMNCPGCMYKPLCEAALMGGDEGYIMDTLFMAKQKRPENVEQQEAE